MIIDFEVFANAVRAGNWIPIPVMILSLGIYATVGFGVSFLLSRLTKSTVPAYFFNAEKKDLIHL
jgi:hypothetical protein